MKKNEIESEKHFTSLQNSHIFICHVVLPSFPMESIVCLNSVRKKIFMAVEERGESCH